MTSHATFPSPIHLFEMKGRDARDFLNRLTSVDVRNLQVGEFRPGFLLNPQGKTQAAFRVAAVSSDSFLIEIEGGKDSHWKDSFLKLLDQFTFTEKYEITEKAGLKCAWIFGLSKASENAFETRGELSFFHGSKKMYGTNWTSIWGPAAAVDEFLRSQSSSVLSADDFESRRISSLTPKIDVELVVDSNPLELGLREGISDNKGCYPGQEVIEKIISLGSPAKRLIKLVGTGTAPSVGDPVFITEEGKAEMEVGKISSVTGDAKNFSALSLVRKNAAHTGRTLSIHSSLGSVNANVERISDYE